VERTDVLQLYQTRRYSFFERGSSVLRFIGSSVRVPLGVAETHKLTN